MGGGGGQWGGPPRRPPAGGGGGGGGGGAVALFGVGLAYYLYRVRTEKPEKIAGTVPRLYDVVYNKYYVDEIYDVVIVRRIVDGSVWLWRGVGAAFLAGIVNGG